MTISAEAEATATRERAEAQANAIEKRGLADASALQAAKVAEAEGMKANLLAEAEGRRELAAATAAEDSINLRQFIIEEVTKADVAKVEAIAEAMAGLGDNVRIVQFGQGGNGHGSATGNTLMDMLLNVPEVAEMFRAKVEALSGEEFNQTLLKMTQMFDNLKHLDLPDQPDGTPMTMDQLEALADSGEADTATPDEPPTLPK